MCDDYGDHADDYQTRIPVYWPNAAPNLQPHVDDIGPTDKAPDGASKCMNQS